MNTVRSTIYGWSALILAAGTGYYWARKDLNQRWSEQEKKGLRGKPAKDWREMIEEAESGETAGAGGSSGPSSSTTPSNASSSTQTSAKAPPES